LGDIKIIAGVLQCGKQVSIWVLAWNQFFRSSWNCIILPSWSFSMRTGSCLNETIQFFTQRAAKISVKHTKSKALICSFLKPLHFVSGLCVQIFLPF
jgi:hypothetical protein